ncbi:MAG TPA: hypothetical protein VII78_02510 [Myxococcota bacterium]
MKRARGVALAALAAACSANGPALRAREPAGPIPFVWPRDGVVTLMTCRFETALPIGVALENATREEETAADAVLRAWEGAGLGVRFLRAPREAAQLAIAFRDEPLPASGRALADCALRAGAAELAAVRVEIARDAADGRDGSRALTREELLGLLAREIGRALGFSGAARAGDPLHVGTLADAARVGAAIRAGERLASPALSALYAQPSGSVIARGAARSPLVTRPVDRLAALALANGLAGPFLRTGGEAGRVFWRELGSGAEYGAQIVSPAALVQAPGSVAVALEARARRALPRSGDALPDAREPAAPPK